MHHLVWSRFSFDFPFGNLYKYYTGEPGAGISEQRPSILQGNSVRKPRIYQCLCVMKKVNEQKQQ